MKVDFSCVFCGWKNSKSFKLLAIQKDFTVEMIKIKCTDCKKNNFVTPNEIKNKLILTNYSLAELEFVI